MPHVLHFPQGLAGILALLILLICLPVLLLIALSILCEDGGPVLFRQQRVGQHGRLFTLIKFRTLCQGPHDSLRPQAYTTTVGAFLRRYGLDELPQLYNILRGEMTLIGPRPILPEEAKHYDPWQCQRLLVRPGLTGWAQVNGRNALPWYERLALDVWYVQHRSIGLDLLILWRTPITLLRSEGVYGPGNHDPDASAFDHYMPPHDGLAEIVRLADWSLSPPTPLHHKNTV